MRKYVRALSLLVVVTLILALFLTGCGTENRTINEEPANADETSEAEDTKESSSSEVEPPEKVTLRVYGPATGLSLPDGIQEDPVSKEIERVTGVSIDLDAHPDDAKFNAMLASGDLPDVLVVCDTAAEKAPSIVDKMIEGDMLLPLDDLIESDGPNLSKLDNVLSFCRKYYSKDTGNLYAIQGYIDPPPEKGFDTGIGPVLRWDYYSEMGYPEIKNGDDWLNVVVEMLEKYPKTEDEETRYGFSLFFEWGWYAAFQPIGDICKGLEGESVVTGRGGFMEFDIMKETVRSEILNKDSALWTGVNFAYKANKMGILDPDTFTNKWDNVIEKTSADRVISSPWTWAYGDINSKLMPEGKGYQLIPMNTKGFVEGTASPLGASFRLWTIPKVSKNPQAAMRLMDYLFSPEGARTIHSGVLDVHYVEEDNKLMIPKEVSEKQRADGNWAINTGIGKYGNFAGLGGNFVDPKYDQKVGLWGDEACFEEVPEMTPLEKAYCEYYDIDRVSDRYAYLEKATFDGTITSVMATPPEDIKAIDQKINDYLGVELPKLIISKDDEEFEMGMNKIIEECKAKGIEQSHEWWMNAWNDAIDEAKQYR